MFLVSVWCNIFNMKKCLYFLKIIGNLICKYCVIIKYVDKDNKIMYSIIKKKCQEIIKWYKFASYFQF